MMLQADSHQAGRASWQRRPRLIPCEDPGRDKCIAFELMEASLPRALEGQPRRDPDHSVNVHCQRCVDRSRDPRPTSEQSSLGFVVLSGITVESRWLLWFRLFGFAYARI
jgi:hypothetical protein